MIGPEIVPEIGQITGKATGNKMRLYLASFRQRAWTIKTALLFLLFVVALLQSKVSYANASSRERDVHDGAGNGEIGQLVKVSGEVQVRLPRKVRFTQAKADSSPFYAQEMLATHGAQSEALLTMETGALIRVLGNSRVVAERDPNHEDAVFFTILSGDIELKKASTRGRLHFSRDGREIEVKVGQTISLIPVIGRHSTHEASGSAAVAGSAATHAVVATVPDEPRVSRGSITDATPVSTAAAIPVATEREKSSVHGDSTVTEPAASTAIPAHSSPTSAIDSTNAAGTEKGIHYTLGNDDITKQIKSQASFFQRCYLNFLTRGTDAQRKSQPAGIGPNGGRVVVVGFSIQNTGRVTQTHIVRSDISDVTLEKCLTEVLGRTSFRAFAGDEIEVSEYPILLQ